ASLRRGDPAGYQSHLLYAEPDGSFSISAMVWMPGQQTMIHDHVAWCVTGVLQGREYEEVFALTDDARALRLAARNVNPAGAVSGFAPPGDIHRVRPALFPRGAPRRAGAPAGRGSPPGRAFPPG